MTVECIEQSKLIPNCFITCVIYESSVSLGTELELHLLIENSTMDIVLCKEGKVMVCWNGNIGVNSIAVLQTEFQEKEMSLEK